MLGGRSYSAYTRPDVSKTDTFGEVREILWRDAVSSYLYLWGIPHLTQGFATLLKPFYPAYTQLEPMVAHAMHSALAPYLTGKNVTANTVKTLWHGPNIQHTPAYQTLTQAIATVHQPQAFWHTLTEGLKALPKTVQTNVQAHLKAQQPQQLTAHTFTEWLDTLAQHPIERLNTQQQHQVLRSLKQAYLAHVGISLHALQQQLLPVLNDWPKAEQNLVLTRLASHAYQHTQQKIALALRLYVNQLPQGHNAKVRWQGQTFTLPMLADRLEALALNPASSQKGFDALFSALPDLLKQMSVSDVLGHQHLQQRIVHFLQHPVVQQIESTQGRAWLPDAAQHILTGALRHNPLFLHQAQQLVGLAPDHYKTEVHPGKLKQLYTSMDGFIDHVLKHWPTVKAPQSGAKATEWSAANKLAYIVKRHNQWPRYISLTLGVLAAMFSLGIAVPRIQYWITRQTTGHDEQPALAALRARYGLAAQ
jgi:hypothetical protein